MNIAVVDDEKVIRQHICSLIKKQSPGCRLMSFASGEELVQSNIRFDIIFLDIRMEGLNGIETAKNLKEKQKDILLIFITGMKEYVFDALDLYAFQYLLKPLDEKKFGEVLERALAEAGKRKERKILFVKAKNLTLDQSDILYIESRGKKVGIHTVRAEEDIEIYAVMEELSAQLGEEFYRCHRGYIVNLAYIAEYGKDSITLTNGARVYLAKKKYGEFVKAYMWYLQSGGVFCV
ncbi:MAG: LytTR family DNA-binding domain-containing protein [Lachnospiraceae bacterium]|nr:LytTR family DNA-binding domain-containing protein [Lachnospiraceae bacterium]MDE6979901.1 LytTR family DNA-binding domain-containing protein [Lachnospiraceae bacterium]